MSAGFGAAVRWEGTKLVGQLRARVVLAAAALGPVPVVAIVHGQSRPPKDSLFGRFALDNGFALALLVLGFAGQWLLPLLTSVVAGDIVASEDHHGTWKTVLTRSVGRGRLFWAKVLVALAFAVAVVVVLATSTIVSATLIVGHQPLVGLSGQLIDPHTALLLVAAAWATMLLPVVAFTCLALLVSTTTRSSAAGIAAPAVLGMVMQLLGTLGGLEGVRPLLLSTPAEAWHGLLTGPRFTGPLLEGAVTCAVWSVACLLVSYVVLRRRDVTGG